MDYKERYEAWLQDPNLDDETKEELASIQGDEKEIEDRFYQNLEFGTAGLRGKLGAGTNRMNIYTVGEATEAFARMLEEEGQEAKDRGVAISFDIRHMSDEFAKEAASIFAAHGIKVYIYKDFQATPILSYTIRYLSTYAGVMITASHNPPEYNGYKAYGSEGSQILDDWAERIEGHNSEIQSFEEVKRMDFEEGVKDGIIEYVPDEVLDAYYKDVLDLTIHDEPDQVDKDVKIVYTPLHGCGNKPVRKVLKARGFNQVHVVEEQAVPDPDFSTVDYPNPEDPKAFALSEKLGKEVDADILIATDPDSDRLAVEVKNDQGGFTFMNGNQIGAVLAYYVISQLYEQGKLPENAAVIKSIVTGDITKAYAKDFPITVFDVLTGFKNIAEPMNEWDDNHKYNFVFGYEESIGFNQGAFVRDKDAVSSAMLLAEAAGFYKKKGMTLLDALKAIYDHYGYYNERLNATVLEGLEGKERINRIMEDFRNHPIQEIGEMKLEETIDYQEDDTGLPKSNVLKYRYDDGSWYAVRPSGTEPKIKVYLYSKGDSLEESEKKLDLLDEASQKKIDQVE